jgi:alkaline phosphatase D
MERKNQRKVTRRRFLLRSAIAGGSIIAADLLSKSGLAQVSAPAIITSDNMRPSIPYGVASGDITGGNALIWSRSDRPARMIVEYDTTESFRKAQRVIGSDALDTTDYTARVNPCQTASRSTDFLPSHLSGFNRYKYLQCSSPREFPHSSRQKA